jgi:hypothetical protein
MAATTNTRHEVRGRLAAKPHALHPAGHYDIFGHELTNLHVAEALRELLGDPLLKLIEHAQRLADEPDHPIHQDAQEALHGRIAGRWSIARYDAPIEWYASQLPDVKNHLGLTQAQLEADHGFHRLLTPAQRALADAAMKRDKRSYHTTEWDDEFLNLFTTQGASVLWHQAANDGVANSGAGVPLQKAWYNNAQAVIGVGDSSTAATNAQFDLQAAANRLWVAMDATFPTLPTVGSSNQITFRSTFGSAQANYVWGEFAVANDNGSNVAIPSSAARAAANGTMLDRVVSAQGTKAGGQTWQPSMNLTLT